MTNRGCEDCYHWQGDGYCAIEPEPTPCEWFVDRTEVENHFTGPARSARKHAGASEHGPSEES